SMPTRLAQQPALDHDAMRYRTQRLLAAHEVDALLWVASFQPEPLPFDLGRTVPAIVLGHPAMRTMLGARTAPTVFIPVATPGVDSGGHLFRVDGSVVAPLSAARASALPTVAAIAARLSDFFAVPDSRSLP
ncbi:MAG: formylmethanofuran dehydrogenase, partial [Caballeronia sp.]